MLPTRVGRRYVGGMGVVVAERARCVGALAMAAADASWRGRAVAVRRNTVRTRRPRVDDEASKAQYHHPNLQHAAATPAM